MSVALRWVLGVCLFLIPMAGLAQSNPQAVQWVEKGLKLNDNSDAEIECYRQAVKIDPQYASAWFNLGFALQARQKDEEALESYCRVTQLDPRRAEAFFNAGALALKTRKGPETARAYLNRYVELAEQEARRQGSHLEEARKMIRQLESEIAASKKANVADFTGAQEIVNALQKKPTRGDSPYSGGRIPIKILFDVNKAEIRADQAPQLAQIAEALKSEALRACQIVIEGHTDSDGASDYNQGLSERRAKAVLDYLAQKHGIDAKRLSVKGCGEDRPLKPNDTAAGKQMNRRVELVNTPGQ